MNNKNHDLKKIDTDYLQCEKCAFAIINGNWYLGGLKVDSLHNLLPECDIKTHAKFDWRKNIFII